MQKIVLEGKEIHTKEDLHAVLKMKLQFPDYYGENLDALWDCLSERAEPLTIEWRDYKESAVRLGGYAQDVRQLFDDLKKELNGTFQVEINP
ncbi:barstar family protein [Aneurinibacillus tyrosinisolvens]|jgi:ribonuclease inhibitor|uniref:barstar family protein n=1 Tax=Aneurinibacillus tyrosinisolvens TaxID=1443435 RepID=UPI00063F6662|nr:barstar family protein [Aneurinibacillus tyrosinisolvens]